MNLRKSKHSATRQQLIEVAVDLFLERGYSCTFIDDIAAAANVSRRTFFNYFPSKQDILSAWFQLQTDSIAACLKERPSGERPWLSLAISYREMAVRFGQDSELALKTRRLMSAEPALLSRKYQCLIKTAHELVQVLEQRIEKTEDRTMTAHIYVQAAIAAYTTACAIWEEHSGGDEPFEVVLHRAFEMSRPAVDRAETSTTKKTSSRKKQTARAPRRT